jgi:hypothetical protein
LSPAEASRVLKKAERINTQMLRPVWSPPDEDERDRFVEAVAWGCLLQVLAGQTWWPHLRWRIRPQA